MQLVKLGLGFSFYMNHFKLLLSIFGGGFELEVWQ